MEIYTDELSQKLQAHLKMNNRFPTNPFYRFILSPQIKPVRDRIERWIDEFPELKTNKDFTGRFTLSESHEKVVTELFVGIALKRFGFEVEHDKLFDGKTPDWYALGKDDIPNFVVEVTTINQPQDYQSSINKTGDFFASIRKIPFGATLKAEIIIEGADYKFDPNQKKISIRSINDWLKTNPQTGATHDVAGFRFELVEWNNDKSFVTANGFKKSRTINPTLFANAIKRKISRYQTIIESNNLPFWVAVQTDERIGLSLNNLREILSGKRGALSKAETKLSPERIRHIISPNNKGLFEQLPLLSGVLWIESDYHKNIWNLVPFYNPFAKNKLPHSALPEVRFLNGSSSSGQDATTEQNSSQPLHESPLSDYKMLRYFLVFWTAQFPEPIYNQTGYSSGQMSFIRETFMSHAEIIADIKQRNPTYEQISITNLLELKREDYEGWICKDHVHLGNNDQIKVMICSD